MMINYFKKRLFWKFFFSYFALALLTMFVMGIVIRILLPELFSSHMAKMAMVLSQRGFQDEGLMMGGRWMMNGSGLIRDLYDIFNQIILDAFLYAIFPSILVALIVSVLMSRKFVRPLQEMGIVADRISEGNFSERLPIVEESLEIQDELQHLWMRFNRMANRLEQVEDMRKKFIGDIAHELRTPLTVIKGAMEGLVDEILKADKATFLRIYRQADRLEGLVDDLQELNYLEMGELELDLRPLDIHKFMQNVSQTMKITFVQKDVLLNLYLPKNSIQVLADEDRLEQIMINLLGNAVQYTPSGGEVWIKVENNNEKVQISVIDTGIGIPKEHLDLVFERFYRVDESRSRKDGGSGIGLTIAK